MAKSLTELKVEIDQLLAKRQLIDELILKISPLKTLKACLDTMPLDADKIGLNDLENANSAIDAGMKDIRAILKDVFSENGYSKVKINTTGQKRIRRSREQKVYDDRRDEIQKAQKRKLGLPAKGRLNEDNQAKLDKAVEAELKRHGIFAPGS